MQPNDHALLLEHQARCRSLYKQAYDQRLIELQAQELQKSSRMEGSLRFDPGRAAAGSLMGEGLAGAGLVASHLLGGPELNSRNAIGAMGIGGLLGAGVGGFTSPSEEDLQIAMLEKELERQKAQSMEQYKAQISGAEL